MTSSNSADPEAPAEPPCPDMDRLVIWLTCECSHYIRSHEDHPRGSACYVCPCKRFRALAEVPRG